MSILAPALILLSTSFNAPSDSIKTDTLYSVDPIKEKIALRKDEPQKKRVGIFKRFIQSLSDYDTTYVSPNYYMFTAMGQNTNFFQRYRISATNDRQSQTLSMRPAPTAKIGPYFGWSWIFLGYTFDVARPRQLGKSSEFNLSLYSTVLGCDLYYVKNEGNFRIRKAKGFGDIPSNAYNGTDFSGLDAKTISISAYYIFNHKHFSYPAAYNQSTVQRKSCGSWMLGAGFSQQTVNFDLDRLPSALRKEAIDQLRFTRLSYKYYYLSYGYAYNWAFARNWLCGVSMMPSIGLRKAQGKKNNTTPPLNDLRNLSFDCISRAGVVYNNTKWFAGVSFINNLYTYRKKPLGFTNAVSFLNIYAGFFFYPKKLYR